MITLIALFRLIEMKAKQRNQRKEQPMNPLTQFKRILILPLLLALALDRARAHGRARGRGDRLEPDRVKRDRRDCGQPPPVSVLHFAMVHRRGL